MYRCIYCAYKYIHKHTSMYVFIYTYVCVYVTFPSDNEQSSLAIFLEASSFVCAVKPDEVLTECAFCEKKRKEK